MSGSQGQLAPGVMLAGKYRIIKPLGAGGMGAVYQALHEDIGRTVAVKVLAPSFGDAPEALARFRREARAAALIGHPAITDVLDFGETDAGVPFIVMEHLRGETLQDAIKSRRTLPVARAVSLALDLLDALAAAHAAGIIHRDLKPPNIFLATHPVPMTKLLDFGISKFQFSEDAPLTQQGVALGTPIYMAPEQIRGEEVVPATDLYAVGAILYRVLTGEVPFGGTNDAAIMMRALSEPVRPLQQLRPEVPAPLAAFVAKLLSKEPEDRAPSASAAREELLRLSRSLGLDRMTEEPPAAEAGLPLLEPLASKTTPTQPVAPPVEAGTMELGTPLLPRADAPPTRIERGASGNVTQPLAPVRRRGALIGAVAVAGGLLAAGLAVVLPRALEGAGEAVSVQPVVAPEPGTLSGAPVAGRAQKASSGAPAAHGTPGTTSAPPVAGGSPGTTSAPSAMAGAPAQSSDGLITLTLAASPASARWVSSTLALDCNPCTVRQPQGTRLPVELRAAGYVSQPQVLVFDQPREVHHTLTVRAPAQPSRGAPNGRLTIDRANPFE